MKYIEFRVRASRQGVEQLTALFMARGIDSICVDDPADIQDILDKKNTTGTISTMTSSRISKRSLQCPCTLKIHRRTARRYRNSRSQ